MNEEMMTDRILQRTELLKRTVRNHPDDAWAHCCLGVCYEKLGLYNRAVEALNRAIGLAPDFSLALRRLGGIYETLDLCAEGRRMVRQADLLEYRAKQLAGKHGQHHSDLFN
jgi:tetratricopeptide (TPR) repeat protein